MKRFAYAVSIALLSSLTPLTANAVSCNGDSPSTAANGMVDGEVRKIDKRAGKITLRHSEIKSLNMPAMTMAFTVKDKATLDQVKMGDKVKFEAIRVGEKLVVTEIQPQRR